MKIEISFLKRIHGGKTTRWEIALTARIIYENIK
jgi:hypothetical protein